MNPRHLCLAALFVSLLALGTEPTGEPPVPPGQHPRLFFSDYRQLGAIRNRANSPEGKAILQSLRWHAYGGKDTLLRQLAARDPKFMADATSQTGILGKFSRQVWYGALHYTMTGEPTDGLAATEMLRVWLSGFPDTDQIKDEKSWGNPWIAMSYDWLYEFLTDAERAKMRRIIASMVGKPTLEDMVGKDWWFGGPVPGHRYITNWTAICSSSVGVTLLSIEGEEGYNPDLLPICIKYCREYLDGGLAPDGAMYEGLGYAGGYGTKDVPYFVMALRRRGVDLVKTTHMSQVPTWLSYELMPWGYEGFPLNQSNGDLHAGEFITFFGQEFGGLARWVFHNAEGSTTERIGVDPGVGFLNGWATWRGEKPDKLPLGHWFSTRGLVFSRSGWGPRDATFVMNTNPLGAGHTHADEGSFCLASNGALFASEGGVSLFTSDFHNLVLIDGRGQAEAQSRVDAYLRSADLTAYADLSDVDQKLSYDRRLEGDFAGPWTWVEYNPVQHADRRSLFVRGATGPFVVIADDLRKDDAEHDYDWLLHTPQNNIVSLDGAGFRLAERFGGKWLQSLQTGAKATFVRTGLKPGTIRGWALVRGLPHVSAWSSNNFRVNGQLAPYNTAYFGLGNHKNGWYWLPIKPLNKQEVELTTERLEVELECATGGQVAMTVFSYKPDWEPGDAIPTADADTVVLTIDDVVQSDKPWDVVEAPKGVCDGLLLGTQPPTLSVAPNVKARTRVIHARQHRVATRYLAVLAPHDEGDGRTLQAAGEGGGQVAELHGKGGTDFIAGAVDGPVTTGRLLTDARAATVSVAPDGKTVKAYAMVGGTKLSFDGVTLADAAEPAHVINDGQTVTLRAPGGVTAHALQLTAKAAVVNGAGSGLPVKDGLATLSAPVLPAEWQTTVSDDGRTVTVTGNGPQPLWIDAPNAVEVIVNGVNRYFLRSEDGKQVCPSLQLGSPFAYTGEVSGDRLAQSVSAGTAKLGDLRDVSPDSVPGQALVAAAGPLDLQLPIAGPSRYKVTLWYLAPNPVEADLMEATGPRSVTIPATTGPSIQRFDATGVGFAGKTANLHLEAPQPFAITAVMLQPEYRTLPANLWSTLGPFPSEYSKTSGKEEFVIAALAKPVGPETKLGKGGFLGLFSHQLDLGASWPGGVDGKTLTWQQSDQLDNAKLKEGVDFAVRCGIVRSQICYAVTFITSPDDRPAELSISCDYWAKGWINGQPLTSDRSPDAVKHDGATFNGLTRYRARFELKKGVNELLIKTHGGMGGSSMFADITDPGDLVISPTR